MSNKVTNSVKQIIGECNRLLNDTESCGYTNIQAISTRLKEEMELLQKIFNDTPGEEYKISQQKMVVENMGIQLEYMARVSLGMYDERFKMRNYANKIYADMKDKFSDYMYNVGIDYIILSEYSELTKWALQFYRRSTHLLFEVDEEDKKMIERIIQVLTPKEGVVVNE